MELELADDLVREQGLEVREGGLEVSEGGLEVSGGGLPESGSCLFPCFPDILPISDWLTPAAKYKMSVLPNIFSSDNHRCTHRKDLGNPLYSRTAIV